MEEKEEKIISNSPEETENSEDKQISVGEARDRLQENNIVDEVKKSRWIKTRS